MKQNKQPQSSVRQRVAADAPSPCLTAVDLFAGSGGLSLGLRRAGFRIAAAVEIDAAAADTYATNHPGVKLIRGDIRQVKGDDLVPSGSVDLVAGCAPCQGFCSLTRKLRRADPRNDLILEMGRLIAELKPRAVLMENVPGLLSTGADHFRAFVDRLRDEGYSPTWGVVQMADHGVPQNRRRVVLTAGRGFDIPLPEPTHAKDASSRGRRWRTVRDAIYGRPAARTVSAVSRAEGFQRARWHVVRDLKPQTKARLKAAVPGQSWVEVDESIRPVCHRGGYRGFMNTYGRMTWDDIAPTMTSGCTTPCKGRFGHPDRRRTTISVREAALIQTFPHGYKFVTESIDAACEMIGNAVPPRFAHAVGTRLFQLLAAERREQGS